MASTSMTGLLQYLRKIADSSHASSVSDAELLDRFVRQHDEAAFELLLWRHQRMVMSVCRRVLGDAHDAEDAFQATFLTLARKAASVGRGDAVASWLHTIAYRIALRARAASQRMKTDINVAAIESLDDPTADAVRRERAAVLDEEINRLPRKYRIPVVLCYLEGKSYSAASRQLGLPVGTLAGRLMRARALLRTRLLRRGIDLSAALLGGLLAAQSMDATASVVLRNATVKMATAMACGRTAEAGALSATVAALTEGVLRSMLVAKLKIGMAALLTGLCITGMGLLVSAGAWHHPPVDEKSAEPPPLSSAKKKDTIRVDDYGDPLPEGVIRRLGTLRFRHGGGINNNLLLTPDGKTLVSNDYYRSRTVCVWDLASGKLLRQFPGTYEKKDIALSADGKLVAISQEEIIVLWNLASGKEVRRFAQRGADAAAFSSDGKILAAAGTRYPDIHLWNLATGKNIARLRDPNGANLLTFTPDGKILIAGQQFGSKIGLWDAASAKKRQELDAKAGDIFTFALSPDGVTLATGSRQGGIPLWDVKTGKLVRKLRAEGRKECTAVAFSPNGKSLAAVEVDAKGQDFLSVWDVAAGKELRRIEGGMGWGVVFSRDGKTLIAGCGLAIRLWDAATGKEVGPAAGSPRYAGLATMSPDGRTLAYYRQDDIHFWDMAASREAGSLNVGPNGTVSFAFAPDGRTVAASVGEHTVNIRDVKSRKLLRRLQWDKKESPYAYWAYGVAYSPDGRMLASADSKDAFVRLWDVASGKQIRRLTMNDPNTPENRWTEPNAVAFSADGRLLAASGRKWDGDSKVRIWEVATGKELPQLTRAMNAPAKGDKPLANDSWERKLISPKLVFSADGRMLAKNGRPKTISVWETLTGQQRLLLKGHDESTECVAFAPDSRTLASASWDNTIRLWDLDTGRELRKLIGHRGKANSLAFSADGKILVSAGDDTTILFWDIADITDRKNTNTVPLSARAWQALWEDLAKDDAAKAYAAMVRMSVDGPTTLAALKERLHPVRPVDPERLARLLKELDSDEFAVREAASRELEKLGDVARSAVRQALARREGSLELRRRLEAISTSLDDISGERLRPLRAIEVLERQGGTEARELLKALAAGAPEALPTTAAQAALKQLRSEPRP